MAGPSRLKLDDYLPYQVNRVGLALVERFANEALNAHQLTIDMWRVLAALANRGAQRQIDLADMTSIEASTMSRLVTRMLRMGLVMRSRSETSSREVVVQLTRKGQALVERLVPVALKLERTAVAGMSASELESTKQALRKIYRNLAGR